MLTLTTAWTPDVLTESLADLVDVLREGPGLRMAPIVLETARGAAGHVLRMLRFHLGQERLLTLALSEVHPQCLPQLREIEHEHRLLKKMSHDLCGGMRRHDLSSARDIAHRFLAISIDHIAHEKRLLTEVVRCLDPGLARRFADAQFEGMIRGAKREQSIRPDAASAVDLHSLHARLIRHLRSTPEAPSSDRASDPSRESPLTRNTPCP